MWSENKNKKEREEMENMLWMKIELRMDVILDWSVRKLRDCERKYDRLLT